MLFLYFEDNFILQMWLSPNVALSECTANHINSQWHFPSFILCVVISKHKLARGTLSNDLILNIFFYIYMFHVAITKNKRRVASEDFSTKYYFL